MTDSEADPNPIVDAYSRSVQIYGGLGGLGGGGRLQQAGRLVGDDRVTSLVHGGTGGAGGVGQGPAIRVGWPGDDAGFKVGEIAEIHRAIRALPNEVEFGNTGAHVNPDPPVPAHHVESLVTTDVFCQKYALGPDIQGKLARKGFQTSIALFETSATAMKEAGFKTGELAELSRALQSFKLDIQREKVHGSGSWGLAKLAHPLVAAHAFTINPRFMQDADTGWN
ncbi:hypothetical protein C8R45DRAFT_1096964 [Mycena sanguinolenta]|nr:hypothetical protein C8R45DRAFT_1096964 [Mycena sanguinolenta]